MGGGGNAEQYNTPVSLPSTISSCWKFAVVYFRTRTLASCPLPQWKEGKKKKKKPQTQQKHRNSFEKQIFFNLTVMTDVVYFTFELKTVIGKATLSKNG